jgi:hypothetical protein
MHIFDWLPVVTSHPNRLGGPVTSKNVTLSGLGKSTYEKVDKKN